MKLPPPFSGKKKNLNVIIETPARSRNKYAYDPETGLFKLSKAFPAGMFFPLEFGFIPGTKAPDGDPIDVIVFMEEPGYPGCFVESRILGVIEAEQYEDGETFRNDRVLAAACESRIYADIRDVDDLDKKTLEDLVAFFKNYHKRNGEKFEVLKISGPEKAIKLIEENFA